MSIPTPVLEGLLAETMLRPRAFEALRRLCDEVGGRTAGAPSGAAGEDWGRRFFEEAALDRVWLEPVPVDVWVRGSLDARCIEPLAWRLSALAHGFAPSSADVTAPVVDVGHGEREQLAAQAGAVRGSMALCDEGATAGRRALHRTEKLALAVEYGASGLLISSSAPGPLPRTGVCCRGEAPIPSLGISLEDGERLRRLLAGGASPRVRVSMANAFGPGTAHNVLAEVRGASSDEVVLAGGHLDSWDVAQGATDNGIGCAIVLEMARALALVQRPRRTLRFALWAAEEVGLVGSRQYARERADELDGHAAVLNFDMTGDPFGYWTPFRSAPAPLLRDLARAMEPVGMRQEFASEPHLHSDHAPFMLAGVPVIGLQATLPNEAGRFYHSLGDTFEKVSQPALCRAAFVGAVTMWAVADALERTWPRQTQAEVDAAIDAANLREALEADRQH